MVVAFFIFLRDLQTVFCNNCTHLHSYQQCISVPFSLPPCQHVLFLVFFYNSHSNKCDHLSLFIRIFWGAVKILMPRPPEILTNWIELYSF